MLPFLRQSFVFWFLIQIRLPSYSKFCRQLFIQIWLPSFVSKFLFECKFEASFQNYHSLSNSRLGFPFLTQIWLQTLGSYFFIRNQFQSVISEFLFYLEFENSFPKFYSDNKLVLRLLTWIRMLKRRFEFKFEKKIRNITVNSNSNKNTEKKFRIWIKIRIRKRSFDVEFEASILETKAKFHWETNDHNRLLYGIAC